MRLIFIAASSFAILAAAPAAPVQVADLEWLAGSWASEAGGTWTEEIWSSPRGGMMLGLNRSGKGSRASGFEYMRIAADPAGRISFWASPGGAAAVPFAMTSSGPREAVFENSKNDYPTRIVYRRSGATLVATISGPAGSRPMTWTFRRR